MSEPAVYVVDDDAQFRTAVGRLLRASGYKATLYESAEQFLKISPAPGPGCILLDIRMSGLSGLELQGRLNKEGIMLPIVFLTGLGYIPTSVKAIKAGAEDFLSKPGAKETLLSTVERRNEVQRRADLEGGVDRTLTAFVAFYTHRERQLSLRLV